jgi:hypothetical protein
LNRAFPYSNHLTPRRIALFKTEMMNNEGRQKRHKSMTSIQKNHLEIFLAVLAV